MQADVAESRSWKRLEILARRPFDLTGEGALAGSGRIKRMVCDSAALKMMFATQRIDEEVLEALQDFADEHRLVHRFNEMRSGVILNKISGWESEERKVLHTTTRDLFSGNPVEPESAAQAETEFRKLSGFLAEIESGKIVGTTGKPFTTMINVGIGGSDLGPRSVYEALKPFRQAG
ncbi:MAG: glucose-6-phosphate isomerase, partial [Proteobacteria bacterium]